MLEAVPNTTRTAYADVLSRGIPNAENKGSRRLPRAVNLVLAIGAALGVYSLLIFSLIYFRDTIANIGNWAYAGVFLAELINSASILVPTPGPAYTFAVAPSLNPFAVGILGGTAAALGELVGYYIGTRGRSAVQDGAMYRRFHAFTNSWGGGALFAFSLLPIPFDVAGIWAGVARYPVWQFLAFVAAGKVIKVTLIAMSGFYSINFLSQFFA